MRVAFLYDVANEDGTLGGAELTMREFALAAPDGVEIVTEEPDTYVVGNCTTFGPDLVEQLEGRRAVRYFNDVDPHSDPRLRRWLLDNAICVFTSPLHVERFPHELTSEPVLVPPAVDLDAFRPTRQIERNTERKGAVAIGAYQNPGKGGQALGEWAQHNDGLDIYGTGLYVPGVYYQGQLEYTDVPKTLWRYETFVHLPADLEPFGRAVVEAWAAGCELIVNRNVGALHWIENDPKALETAAEDFWSVIIGAAGAA